MYRYAYFKISNVQQGSCDVFAFVMEYLWFGYATLFYVYTKVLRGNDLNDCGIIS